MDEPVCPGHRDALKRIAELGALVAERTHNFEEAMCVGKRRSALSRKGPQPHRKSGNAPGTNGHRSPPLHSVSESRRATLPGARSRCPGPLIEMGAADDQSGSRRSAGPCAAAPPVGLSSHKAARFSTLFGTARAGGDLLQGVGSEPLSTTRRESALNPRRTRLRPSSPRLG